MKRLLWAFAVVLTLTVTPESRPRALSCSRPEVVNTLGTLTRIERVDGGAVDGEALGVPLSACFRRWAVDDPRLVTRACIDGSSFGEWEPAP